MQESTDGGWVVCGRTTVQKLGQEKGVTEAEEELLERKEGHQEK